MSELAEIYRIYFDDVYRYLLALSHDAQLAEELTSETFCRAMRALPGFRGACDIRVWLCQIAKNCFYTEQKRMGRIELLGDGKMEALPASAPSLGSSSRTGTMPHASGPRSTARRSRIRRSSSGGRSAV